MKVQMLLLGLLLFGNQVFSQTRTVDYQRAEQFLSHNIDKLIFNQEVHPVWTGSGSNFWYRVNSEKGKEFYYVDLKSKTKSHAFDHDLVAVLLTKLLNREMNPYDLPFTHIRYSSNDRMIEFSVDSLFFRLDLDKKMITKQASKKSTNSKKTEKPSPDGRYIAFIKNFNLYVFDTEKKDTVQLSFDGEDLYDYAAALSWYDLKNESKNEGYSPEIEVYWSPDSEKIIAPRINRRHAKKLYMYKSEPETGFRSEVLSYERPLAGDSLVTTKEYVLFDLESKQMRLIDIEPFAEFLSWKLNWFKDASKAYLVIYSRGYKSRRLIEIDGTSAKSRLVMEEHSASYVDVNTEILHVNEKDATFFWASEKDGWHHLYLHDWNTGREICQVTKGNYFVRGINYIDYKKNLVYYTANGKDELDPYHRQVFVCGFDGSGLKVLTEESAEHDVVFSPDGNYFVDNFSSIDQPNVALLRRSKNGKKILKLEEMNVEALKKIGWKVPERFCTTARDGKTRIYGLVFKPSDFDPSKRYPVIDGTYSGPQTIRAPKSFRRACMNNDLALAELGFIVVNVDGLGSAFRSKEFHDVSYKNLGDIGGPDHIKFIKDLAKKYNFVDTNRVGIYGHSAGGYDAVRALIAYNDFYSVAVSSAGNHDHRIAKAWWPELYMGYPLGKHYDEQSNIFNAEKLKGKLLLVHGDLDNNVNPAASMRMANALIKANKDVDLLIIPNKDHSSVYYDTYFIRKRWDFFVKHLLKIEPPKEYKIN